MTGIATSRDDLAVPFTACLFRFNPFFINLFVASLTVIVVVMPGHVAAADGINDDNVRKWIKSGFDGTICIMAKAPFDLNQTAQPASIRQAFARLKKCRDSGMAADLELAAAENYVFIRWAAGETGDTNIRSLPIGYFILKQAAFKLSLQDFIKTSKQPPSKPDTAVLSWGEIGVEHGLADYEARTKTKPTAKHNAMEITWDFLKRRYYGK